MNLFLKDVIGWIRSIMLRYAEIPDSAKPSHVPTTSRLVCAMKCRCTMNAQRNIGPLCKVNKLVIDMDFAYQ